MLLKNGKVFVNMRANASAQIPIKRPEGTMDNMYSSNQAYSQIVPGSSDTPVTPDDYSITQINDLGLTLISNTGNFNTTWANNYIGAFSSIYKNNTSEPITVNEIGVRFYDTYRDGFVHYYLTRDVFEEPVVIHPGESHTFSVTIG